MKDSKIMRYIPKSFHDRITEAWIEKEADYNEATGKFDNRYYIVLDGEEHFFNNIKFMKEHLKEEYGI